MRQNVCGKSGVGQSGGGSSFFFGDVGSRALQHGSWILPCTPSDLDLRSEAFSNDVWKAPICSTLHPIPSKMNFTPVSHLLEGN